MQNDQHLLHTPSLLSALATLPLLSLIGCGDGSYELKEVPQVSEGMHTEYALPACSGAAPAPGGSGTGSGAGAVVTLPELKPQAGSGSGTPGPATGAMCVDANGNVVSMSGNGSSGTSDNGSGYASVNNCTTKTFSYPGDANEVWVSGSFTTPTEWATTVAEGALVLEKQDDGTFLLETDIPEGLYEYKIVLNGSDADNAEWIVDPNNPETAVNEFEEENSVLSVCRQQCGDLQAFDWRDTVMYFAMVDRFNDSDGMASPVMGATDGALASGQYKGGDIQGVTDKVPYLEDLGVSAIWISAPYENRDELGKGLNDDNQYTGYHGYWPSPADIDYSSPASPSPTPAVEDKIGTSADLKAFISAAHGTTTKNGHSMKVLFDYVMNHVDGNSGLAAAHPDWFYEEEGTPVLCSANNHGNWDDPFYGTRCAFTEYLPVFDFDNAEARTWSINDAIWWAKEYEVDGYRLDAIKHVPLSWLTDLRARVETEALDQTGDRFYMVGETFAYDDRDLLKKFVDPDTMLDGQFDFPFKKQLCQGVLASGGDIGAFADWMDGNEGFYGAGSIMTTWIGNHDIPRAIHFASREIGDCSAGSNPDNGWAPMTYPQPADAAPYERLGVAFAVMFTNPGIPLIYYGDEIGLAGGGDPDNRRMMPWSDGDLNAHQIALRARVKNLGRIRGENPVLTRGNRSTAHKDQDTWVYEMRGCEEDTITVAINKSDEAKDVTVPAGKNLETDADVAAGTLSLGPRDFILIK